MRSRLHGKMDQHVADYSVAVLALIMDSMSERGWNAERQHSESNLQKRTIVWMMALANSRPKADAQFTAVALSNSL